MGDISAEPSMEDILSSIKRIIAEEGDSAVAARAPRRSAARPIAPPPVEDPEDEVLELREPAPPPAAEPVAVPARAPAPTPAEAPRVPAVATGEPIVSREAEEATRSPLAALSRLVVKPETSGSDTLEGLVRELLRPMLREWLDARLPEMVESMVAKEIARITGAR
jgi:uncharacterized protein